jgi:hypothetical protein
MWAYESHIEICKGNGSWNRKRYKYVHVAR